ncbi:MAG: hypothetical protein QM500_19785 [Methylococcales bacterium]
MNNVIVIADAPPDISVGDVREVQTYSGAKKCELVKVFYGEGASKVVYTFHALAG